MLMTGRDTLKKTWNIELSSKFLNSWLGLCYFFCFLRCLVIVTCSTRHVMFISSAGAPELFLLLSGKRKDRGRWMESFEFVSPAFWRLFFLFRFLLYRTSAADASRPVIRTDRWIGLSKHGDLDRETCLSRNVVMIRQLYPLIFICYCAGSSRIQQ